MVKLICTKVVFYSEGDESSFFDWISKIRAVSKWEGVGDQIHLYLPRLAMSQRSLRELVALFYRYDIDMRQLAQFENEQNRRWFTGKGRVWYERVFGDGSRAQ